MYKNRIKHKLIKLQILKIKMNKLKTLKNILLATTFGVSFGFNKGYSQEKEYYLGNPNNPKSEIKKIDEKTYNEMLKKGWSRLDGVWEKNYSVHKDYIVPIDKPKITQKNPPGNNLSKTTQEEWEKAYEKNASRNSNTQNKPTPNTPSNYNYPRYNNASKKSKTNFGDVLNTTNNVLNLTNTLIEIFKPQPTYIYPAQPINKNPSEIYNESKKSPEWDWQTNKSENVKNVDGNFWDDKEKKTESKSPEGNFWDDKPSKELSDLVKEQNKYSPETKKKLEEEAKISDEYFKEIGMNPGAQVKYKVVGTTEIGPDGKLIKKDSYSPEREITDEEKVILYYAYKAMKKHPVTGSVMEGVEIMNNPEKVDEFFKEKGMNPGAQTKYNVLGTAEIGPNGELIKKDSYSPARELTDEEKVILYYAYNLSKNYTQAGPVIKGVETINKLEKDVDFLFAKPIGDNTYSYFKLAGKEDYFVMKDSPSGNAIMNVANFKEKTKKSVNFWDD